MVNNIFKELEEKYTSIRGNYISYIKYIHDRFDNDIITADIGVWSGWNSHIILETLNPKEHHMIDPYQFYDAYIHKSKFGKWDKKATKNDKMTKTNEDMNNVYNDVYNAFKSYDNVIFIRDFAEKYLKTIEDEYFHFMIIEVNMYNEEKNIILGESLRTLKKDGFMCVFPDYSVSEFENKHIKEIKKYKFFNIIQELRKKHSNNKKEHTFSDKYFNDFLTKKSMIAKTLGYMKL